MSRRSSRSRTHRRSRGRFGPLFKLLCVLAVVVALTGGATVFFRVETVEVTGNQRYTQEEIIAASGIQMGDNLYALNKVSIDRKIRTRLPYVGELSINRALPSTIRIDVTEWEAVAQVAAPGVEQVTAYQEEAGEKAAAVREELGEGKKDGEPAALAQEPWLISVRGKLLEQAPENSTAIAVTGLTAIAPQAGEMVKVPEGEATRLEALTALLGAMEDADLFREISRIQLEATRLIVRYADRFDVKMKLNADFGYNIRLMRAVREQMEEKYGPEAAGTIDLTQEKHEAVYSPAKPEG